MFDFIKKKIRKSVVEEIVVERLSFSEVEKWVENKIQENKKKESVVVPVIKEKIGHFVNEVEAKIINLENFDLDSKKEGERVKNIVDDNRKIYIGFLEKLIRKISELEETNFEQLVEEINNIFSDFNKKSFKSYERATYLIGKEMLSIKEGLGMFSKDILGIFDENKDLITFYKNILVVEEKINMVISINKMLIDVSANKSNLVKKIQEKEKKQETLNRNLEKIKVDPAYLENLAKLKNTKTLEKEIEKDVSKLKQLIDFKALAGFFHMNSKKMDTIKDYKEHFQANFEKNNGETMTELLTEAKLNSGLILEKMKEIRTKMVEMENQKTGLKEDEVEKISSEIKKVNLEIENIKADKIKEEKRFEKLGGNKEDAFNMLKKSLKKFNVELV